MLQIVPRDRFRLLEQRCDIGKARLAPLAGERAADQIVDAGDRLAGAPMRDAEREALPAGMKCDELRARRIGDYGCGFRFGFVGVGLGASSSALRHRITSSAGPSLPS